jgi:hypothetical protein
MAAVTLNAETHLIDCSGILKFLFVYINIFDSKMMLGYSDQRESLVKESVSEAS